MIVSEERTRTQADISRHASSAAAGLEKFGLRSGDVLALLLRNDFPMFEASQAAGLLGVSAVPINWHFGGDEIAYILRDSGAKALVAHSDLLRNADDKIPSEITQFVVETPPEIAAAYGIPTNHISTSNSALPWHQWLSGFAPTAETASFDQLSTIIYTSGTTGSPKGVQRVIGSTDTAKRAARSVGDLYGFNPDARTAVTGPMYHSAINAYGLGMAAADAFVRLLPRFDAEQLLAAIEGDRLTHLHLVPIMFTRLLKLPEQVRRSYDVSSLQHVVHAAAPCPAEVKRKMIDWWGPIIHEYFGSTESRAIAACNSQQWLDHPGTVGHILPNTDIEIVDDRGNALPPGGVGEIYARNHDVEDFTYVGDPHKRRQVDRKGLVTSGDVGYLDDDGYLFLCDRRRDMINSGGVNIYPIEIEACLLELPQIEDCAVFGIPDNEYGESVAAAIKLKPQAMLDSEAVQNFVREKLARYKAPKLVEFVSDFPRDDSGKVFKRKLREPYWRSAGRTI